MLCRLSCGRCALRRLSSVVSLAGSAVYVQPLCRNAWDHTDAGGSQSTRESTTHPERQYLARARHRITHNPTHDITLKSSCQKPALLIRRIQAETGVETGDGSLRRLKIYLTRAETAASRVSCVQPLWRQGKVLCLLFICKKSDI